MVRCRGRTAARWGDGPGRRWCPVAARLDARRRRDRRDWGSRRVQQDKRLRVEALERSLIDQGPVFSPWVPAKTRLVFGHLHRSSSFFHQSFQTSSTPNFRFRRSDPVGLPPSRNARHHVERIRRLAPHQRVTDARATRRQACPLYRHDKRPANTRAKSLNLFPCTSRTAASPAQSLLTSSESSAPFISLDAVRSSAVSSTKTPRKACFVSATGRL